MTPTLEPRRCKCGRDMLACPSGWVCETCGGKVKPYSEKERKLAITVVAPQRDDGGTVCKECNGLGTVECDECNGIGEQECSHCGAYGECEDCGGAGRWTCDVCEVEGVVKP